MDVELVEIRDFLVGHHPFDLLPEKTLGYLPKQISVRYFRRGTPFPPNDVDRSYLYIVRRGAIELRNERGKLVDKLAEGDLFLWHCRPEDQPEVTLSGHTAEDTLVYLITCTDLDHLRDRHQIFSDHFEHPIAERLRHTLRRIEANSDTRVGLITVRVSDLIGHAPVATTPDTSIRDAARIMTEQHVPSLLLMEGARLVGLVTDHDLRRRCLATGLSTTTPVRAVMTENPHTTEANALGFQALIAMTRLNIHYLPVLDDGRVTGVVSTSDLMRFQSADPVYLVGDIHTAPDLTTLVRISARVPELQAHLVVGGATADQIGQVISAITDALTNRLLELAETELGPPPVPYAWLTGGSQARREQASGSDQDNALLLADQANPGDDAYFAALANRVNDGLAACGHDPCPGEVMARNPKWRQPLRVWRRYFTRWIERPEPMALMLANVFFDLRPLRDTADLFGELHEQVLEHSRANRIFIAHMAANALKHRPPIGFFRNFVLISGGAHDRTLDLKHRGTVPIVDLARVYALTAGIPQTNTIERLQAGTEAQTLSRDGAENLIDALALIGILRMRHQAHRIRAGKKADNYLSLDELSSPERGHLKDAFTLVARMQESLEQRHQTACFP